MKQNLCIQISDEIGQSAKNLFYNYDSMLFDIANKFLVHLSERERGAKGSRSMVKRTTWAQGRVSCHSAFHTRSDLQKVFFFHPGYLPLLFQWCCGCVWTGQEPGSNSGTLTAGTPIEN